MASPTPGRRRPSAAQAVVLVLAAHRAHAVTAVETQLAPGTVG
ncbi:hypothetical protein [Nonomuraea sp. NPDC049158]